MRRLVALCSIALTGCSSVLGIDSERHLVEADAGDVTSPFRCLDSAPRTPPATATLSFVIGDPSTSVSASTPDGMPIPGLVVEACTALDFACAMPILSSAPTDVNGRTSLVVPGGFDGFFQAKASGGLLPSIFAHEPITGSEVVNQSVLHESLLELAANLVNVKLDPTAGTVVASVLDCDSQPAAGVLIDVGTLDASEKFFYLVKSIPSKAATSTDATGSAFALNAPAGSVTVKATTSDGRLIASNSAVVRAGWVTFVQLVPSQATLLSK